jgi:hypothetical protein
MAGLASAADAPAAQYWPSLTLAALINESTNDNQAPPVTDPKCKPEFANRKRNENDIHFATA